jgi:hypothetical protein
MDKPVTARGRSLRIGIGRVVVRVVARPITARGRLLAMEVNNGSKETPGTFPYHHK